MQFMRYLEYNECDLLYLHLLHCIFYVLICRTWDFWFATLFYDVILLYSKYQALFNSLRPSDAYMRQ